MENFDITGPKKAKVMRRAGEVTMITFFDEEGLMYQHDVYQSDTVTAVHYQEVLRKMIAHFKENALTKRLKKFFCITRTLAHMLRTPSSNFWRNEASKCSTPSV